MATYYKQYRLPSGVLTLRNAAPDDALEILALTSVYYAETDFLSYEPGEFSMTEADERDYLLAQQEDPLSRYIVAVMDGAIVGTSSAVIDHRRRRRHRAGLGIVVRKSHWRHRIGQTMMEDTIAWLRDMGIERAELTVDTMNLRAIALYMKLGFVVQGRTIREHKLADGSYRDSYHMALDLTD